MARSGSFKLLSRVGALLVLGVCSTALSARAQAPAPVDEPSRAAPGEVVTEVDPIDIPPEHDPLAHAFRERGAKGGFYFRVAGSLGVNSTRLGPPPWDYGGRHAHGFGTNFNLDVGGVVLPWLALTLDSSVGILWNGNVHYEDSITGTPREKNRVVAYGFAPAATFFVPYGFIFKTAFGVGFANVYKPGKDIATDPGFYMNVMAGKELYADEHVSFALQFQVLYMLLGYTSKSESAALGTSNLDARVTQYMFGFSFAYDSL